jgi:hypothetical protein
MLGRPYSMTLVQPLPAVLLLLCVLPHRLCDLQCPCRQRSASTIHCERHPHIRRNRLHHFHFHPNHCQRYVLHRQRPVLLRHGPSGGVNPQQCHLLQYQPARLWQQQLGLVQQAVWALPSHRPPPHIPHHCWWRQGLQGTHNSGPSQHSLRQHRCFHIYCHLRDPDPGYRGRSPIQPHLHRLRTK